jgi:hypothetical protein
MRKYEDLVNLWDFSYAERVRLCDHVFYLRYIEKIESYKNNYIKYQEMLQELKQKRIENEV